jgi:hypothetical protein
MPVRVPDGLLPGPGLLVGQVGGEPAQAGVGDPRGCPPASRAQRPQGVLPSPRTWRSKDAAPSARPLDLSGRARRSRDPAVTVAVVMPGFVDAVQFGPQDDLGYRRPPVTASFEDLRRRGLPEVLFVNSGLPEGVTICDVNTFAAMIEEAYSPPMGLLVHEPGEHGNQLLWAVGFHGIGQWAVITPRRSGWRMTLAPERDGQRQVTVEAWTKKRDYEENGPALATFTIGTRPAGRRPGCCDQRRLRVRWVTPLGLFTASIWKRPSSASSPSQRRSSRPSTMGTTTMCR